MLVSSFAILATLLPALASTHNPPPALKHRRFAQEVKARDGLAVAGPAPRANSAHAEAHRVIKKAIRKRDTATCRPRASASAAESAASASPAPAAAAALSAAPSQAAAVESASPSPAWSASPSPSASPSAPDNQQAWAQQAAAPSASPSPSSSSGGGGGVSVGVSVNVGNLLQVTGNCGWCDSNSNQPNGAEWWLNCGLDSGGWNPPFVSCQELVAVDLDASGVFAPCAQYIDMFNQYGSQYGIHPIMLASFAMQESTCNAGATGKNGEAGLMQITPANCQAGNNCWDPNYNIQRGAQLFSQMVASNGGNCIAAIGNYNGWYSGMTQTSVYNTPICTQQQNLDYLFQFTNGWMQNKNAYSMGSFFNLARCG
ncbi:hypothetical protein BD324DRAFT_629536 [Kockovaella imperatae]|uniref:Transglycosylase SLT domain-containing protein n=1 Tax=Kockovaella imperatae TaxID=4999 RepID=A0A1Y1UCY8_9TREE|nr:hypothetical protein BD324DRAFT_629536 [Kockovaella imperatae]ORX35918.1 hypothetical protein BD324DRAFT_629536 [Kockovaella imperatae]